MKTHPEDWRRELMPILEGANARITCPESRCANKGNDPPYLARSSLLVPPRSAQGKESASAIVCTNPFGSLRQTQGI